MCKADYVGRGGNRRHLEAPFLALPHADPFDRLFVAEAIVLGVPLITKDGIITDSGVVRVIW